MNGIEAIEKALRAPFDLYIVDINMPKLDGYGFMKNLRGEDILQAPAIMVSTESSTRDLDAAYRAGANGYLIKPIKPDQLLAYARLLLGSEES